MTKYNNNWTTEEWVTKQNEIIDKFIKIEKSHLQDNGTPDATDSKIVDELFEEIVKMMEAK